MTRLGTRRTKPLVSVIMPVYNAERYLDQAIASLRKQTEPRFELLIIDDGSTDASWKKLRLYARTEQRIRLWRNPKNIGLALSLNRLLPKTRGQYIARMDADDVAFPRRLAQQVAFLQSHPTVVACGGQIKIIDRQAKILADKPFPLDPASCYNRIMNHIVIQPSALLARASVMRRLRYDNHIFGNDDISMHFKLLEQGQVANLPHPILYYRKLAESLTHRDPKRVYFLALRVRLKAILSGSYAPKPLNLLLAIPETAVVAILPSRITLWLFDLWRTRHRMRDKIRRHLTKTKRSMKMALPHYRNKQAYG